MFVSIECVLVHGCVIGGCRAWHHNASSASERHPSRAWNPLILRYMCSRSISHRVILAVDLDDHLDDIGFDVCLLPFTPL